ncbi:MAG: hypothetical protein JWM80_1479 [Cyanobacteria bacterium RYN_339]|nr:hypothetical protein [Cyanobacteria bacterium RYN_339]
MSEAAPATPTGGVLRWALALALLVFVGWQVVKGGQELMARHVTLAPWPLAGSLLGLGAFLVLGCEGWRRLIGALGHPLPYRQAFAILFVSNLGKYLPGGVWNLLGRVVLCERAGVPKLATTISLLMETACQVVAALLVGLLMLPVFASHSLAADPRLLAAAVGAIALGMHPRVLNAWLALGQRLTGKELPRLPFSYGFVLVMLAFYTCNWLLLGGAFALLGQALSSVALSVPQIGLLVGAFAVAWNAGVFAFFFPAGLGVREAALLLLLGPSFPAGWPAALALVARLWFTVAEVAAFGLAGWLGRR